MLRNRSPNQSNASSEILEVVAQTELLRILECPVCKEVPFPPIFNCNKGHIICHQCKPKLTKCPLCTANFSEGRNFAVETIIMSSKHSCKYKDFGCKVVLTGDVMSAHIRECQFGCLQIRCHLGKYNRHNNNNKGCQVNLVPVNKYMDHLKEKHMILRSISKAPLIIFESPTLTELDDTFWLGDYQIFDGETFLVRQFVVNKLIYFSLAVIADDEVAKKYSAIIKISSKKNKVCRVEWSVPVHSIQHSEESIKDIYCGVAPIFYVMHLSEIVLSHGKEKMVFQYEDSFQPRRLRNWTIGTNPWPGDYACPRRCPTKFIADDNGHLLPCVPRNCCTSPWGDYRTSIWEAKCPCVCLDMLRNPTDYMRPKRSIFVTREVCFPHAEAHQVIKAFTPLFPQEENCNNSSSY